MCCGPSLKVRLDLNGAQPRAGFQSHNLGELALPTDSVARFHIHTYVTRLGKILEFGDGSAPTQKPPSVLNPQRKMDESSLAMVEQSLSKWGLERGQYLGEISALCFIHLPPQLSSLPYLIAGTGSQVLVYDLSTSRLIKSFQVFEGIRVHGISLDNASKKLLGTNVVYKVSIFGEKRVKIFNLCIEADIHSYEQSELVDFSNISLTVEHALPRFSHWVLDVCFLKDSSSSSICGNNVLAIGCTDNSVCLWDISSRSVISQVTSPDRCLLYSMRMWGDGVENLQIASGTIYNEIIIWKVVSPNHAPGSENLKVDGSPQYEAVHLCRLIGHEGSIFRIVWSVSGSKLASVSDDRSCRIWTLNTEGKASNKSSVCAVNHDVDTFFGHSARVWDCCMLESMVITAGEDCTCRVWGLDGSQLKIIREHIGRGVWRCLYDPESSLLISAGFDSAIKVHKVPTTLYQTQEKGRDLIEDIFERKEVLDTRIPNSFGHVGHMDSRSEYVRCLKFSRQDSLYVATNNGFLYHVGLPHSGNVKWSYLVRVCEDAPIVCLDLLSNSSDFASGIEDWIAVGDGKGSMTIVQVVGDVQSPEVKLSFSWSAELERQLLGTYWSKSLGHRFIFTANPRGSLKLWSLYDIMGTGHSLTSDCACLVAEYLSSFGMRIMCLDASVKEEMLVCGDIRGNLLVFPLERDLELIPYSVSDVKRQPLSYFKGAHGISSVCSVSITSSTSGQLEISTTGGDGCICYLEYDTRRCSLGFVGMKQVKELSTVGYMFSTTDDSDDLVHGNYAVGFASSDFIIWNLTAEAKVVQIACGGWRRPHSFYLGDLPEIKNCFAFVKDEVIYIHRKWVDVQERNIYPRNLHLQFHGREIHSLCFVPEDSNWNVNGKQDGSKSCCVATGCEDGTVRLTRFESGIENWSASKLLGEHVGGSAVRSICFVSKMHRVELDPTYMPHVTCRNEETGESEVGPFLLMSVGAKKVVTCWKCKTREKSEREDGLHIKQNSKDETANYSSSSAQSLSSMSFQWLTTDMPTKSSNHDSKHVKKHMVESVDEITSSSGKAMTNGSPHVERKLDLQQHHVDKHENDWRYLDVASFLVDVINFRVFVCFIVIACSDATLTLRALILPHRLWFDVAVLAPLSSPVLALQHVAIPKHLPCEGSIKNQSLHIVVSGATDGSITFWDLTAEVENFVQRVPSILMENNMDHQKRPRTGRGSQGGRWWRSLGGPALKKHPIHNHNGQSDSMENLDNNSISEKIAEKSDHGILDVKCEIPYSKEEKLDICQDICEIGPLHVLNNVHQSGVNCLHVSNLKETGVSGSEFLYSIISGGDDQAVNCLTINLSLEAIADQENCSTAIGINSCMEHCRIQDYWMTLTSLDKNYSAHSSAVKGVWTDGRWVFSTGLDQRLRCWVLAENGKLIEHSNLVISVPEPESLDARICSRNYYQIAISGRGLQMVDFFASGNNRSGN